MTFFHLPEWLNLAVRWFHVFAGILWIGQTYYFTWLDGQFTAQEQAGRKGDGPARVWMVHSGGFYVVEKQKAPAPLPAKLHWFRYEAAFTWLSGMVLLVLVYYLGGAFLDEDVSHISLTTGIAIGLGLLVVTWVVYDLLVQSPLGRSHGLFAVVAYIAIAGIAYGLCHLMSGRAAYIHVGAMFGTIMTANVWMRILPAQRKMIAALKEDKAPDATLAERSKLRSKHNTFMVMPLVFIMISNHFPVASYGDRYNWAILTVLILAGWAAAKIVRNA